MEEKLNKKNTPDLFLSRLSRKQKIALGVVFIFAVLAGSCLSLALLISPPSQFPTNRVITIEKGKTFNEISQDFKKEKLIRSSFLFETLAWLLRKETEVKAGEYFFEKRIGLLELIKKITDGSYQNNLIKVTIPEGYSVKDIVNLFKEKGIWAHDEKLDKSLEGYLFPDTYYVPADITPEAMAKIMQETFDKKVRQRFGKEIKKSGRKFSDIIIMASLLEKEASKKSDKKIISHILWKRLDNGMPLQVDAVFPYIIEKNSYQLTFDDLKIDSPYNTYLYKGLPPGPICNPGLESIEAALNPAQSNYWYYLSDKEGNIHYSKTYKEHLGKKQRYLKK